MKRAGNVKLMGERRNAYRTVVGKPEGRKSFGKSDHTGIVLKQTLKERILVNRVMNLWIP
jgi:hypothetical protein